MASGKTSKCTLEGVFHVLKSTTIPRCQGHPLQRVAIDIVGPTPRSTSGHEWLLVVSDHFTKFSQAFPVRNTSAVTLAKKVMDEYICRFGCFEGLHSDHVDGAVFKGLCDLIRRQGQRRTIPKGMGR